MPKRTFTETEVASAIRAVILAERDRRRPLERAVESLTVLLRVFQGKASR